MALAEGLRVLGERRSAPHRHFTLASSDDLLATARLRPPPWPSILPTSPSARARVSDSPYMPLEFPER